MHLGLHFPVIAILCIIAGCGIAAAGEPQPVPAPNHWPAALAAVANMGFADDRAGDGVGGWSDQGWSNSFAEFEVGRSAFGGVPFAIVDPVANAGKAVVTFRHETVSRGPAEVVAPFPAGTRGRYLYLLHTACWAGGASGTVVGHAEVRGRDGAVSRSEIQIGRELGDWWNPVSMANGSVVVSKPNQSALVGVYLSRFDLGSEVEAVDLRLATTGKALWIVVGATLSARDLPLPERKPLTITAGSEWKALPSDDLVVKAGTALDRSAWVGDAPAGSHGRVIARPDGSLAFADDPATPVRFFGCSGPEWVFPTDELADPEAFAEAVRRQGYNLVRFHFLDHFLAGRPKSGQKLDAAGVAAYDSRAAAGDGLNRENLAVLDRVVAAMKKRGIYLFLDAMTSNSGYYPVNGWDSDNGVMDLKTRMYGDPAARAHYRATVTQLLTHRNPLTGTTLAEDPMVAVVLGFNEQENNLWSSKPWKIALLPPWRAFLAKRYADPAAWWTAIGGKGPAPASFAEAPLFLLEDTWAAGKRGAEVAEFLAAIEAETADFMKGVIRDAGYRGIFTQYDYFKNLRYYLPRATHDAVTMHGYHAHPNNYIQPGSKILQTSALGDALGWWRGIASARIAGRPQLFTEYGHVYWSRYRYEEGLSVGAYAALQDVGMLLAHAHPVRLRGRTIRPFAVAPDPVARASQVVTGLAWRGGAVATARHRVDIALSRAEALAKSESALARDQTGLLLLTGFATAVEGGPTAAPKADLVLPLLGGAKVVSTNAETNVQDQGAATGFPGAVADLRRRGILPPDNRTDAIRSLYQSDTGEIVLDARLRRLSVATPTLAAICADEVGEALVSGDLRLAAASVPVSATAASLDGRPLTGSARILLVVATDARNGNEQYEDSDGMVMKKLGDGPVLVRTGRFALDLARKRGGPTLRAWALAQDGTRHDEIAVQVTAAGVHLDLDSAAWACGPTPYIELAER
jgi:hypothetical protein